MENHRARSVEVEGGVFPRATEVAGGGRDGGTFRRIRIKGKESSTVSGQGIDYTVESSIPVVLREVGSEVGEVSMNMVNHIRARVRYTSPRESTKEMRILKSIEPSVSYKTDDHRTKGNISHIFIITVRKRGFIFTEVEAGEVC